MDFSLMAAKLRPPLLPSRRVLRQRLLERLDEGLRLDRRMTLVSAPAGFGKTTCVVEWLQASNVPAAWLSLESADDDPGRFFAYLIAALQTIEPSIGQDLIGVLRAGGLPPEEILCTTLGNDLLELENRLLLVLDDFQVIQDTLVLRVLERLATGPSQTLHLVLVTREDPPLPLARLRANNQLTEIRAADLRLSGAETGEFLNGVMELSLSVEDVGALGDRTEGWIVGLHLAGLSLRERRDPSILIGKLTGGHRHILAYLAEEVLQRQSEEVLRFLMQTSILERLTGGLCDALTGRNDGAATLERLFRANLFLTPQDDRNEWYRYHLLFADLLRERQSALPPEATAELHRRAAGWYSRANMVDEAIRHSLAAADYSEAVRLIETHAMDLLMQWHVKTVEDWIRSIPAEWSGRSLRANLAFAWANLMHGDPARAAPYLQKLATLFAEPGAADADPALRAKWLALQCMLMNAQGQAEESIRLGREALTLAPVENAQARCMVLVGLAGAYQQREEYDKAAEAFEEIICLGREEGRSVYELLGVSGLALITYNRGKLHLAFETALRGIERMEASGSLPPISTAIYGELGSICYEWHQLDRAHRYFRRAIQASLLTSFSDARLFYGVILSRLHLVEGDVEAAGRAIRESAELMRRDGAVVVREEVIAQQIRVCLARGRIAEAERMIADEGFSYSGAFRYPSLVSARPLTGSIGTLYASALRILIARAGAGRDPDALQAGLSLADRLAAEAFRREFVPFGIHVLLLRARLHRLAGNESAGYSDYQRALELAEPEQMISAFVEEGAPVAAALSEMLAQNRLGRVQPAYVRSILSAFAAPTRPPAAENAAIREKLSEREREVLRRMAEGLSYEEAADKLSISLNTVRSHVKAIYGKLGVNNRTKALEMAHDLKLL